MLRHFSVIPVFFHGVTALSLGLDVREATRLPEYFVYSKSLEHWYPAKQTSKKDNITGFVYGPEYSSRKWLYNNSSEFFRPDKAEKGRVRQGTLLEIYHAGTEFWFTGVVFARTENRFGILWGQKFDNESWVDKKSRIIRWTGSQKRGIIENATLHIAIRNALSLRSDGNIVSVKVQGAELETKKTSASPWPIWDEVLTFRNFRPSQGKTATVTVKNQKLIPPGRKVVGTATFSLPASCNNKAKKLSVDIFHKNKATGILIVEQWCLHTDPL